jgi:hypothetical protein
MKQGSTDLEEFYDDIRTVKMDSIPKNLRYLMTNIECFIDISGQTRQWDARNKENYVPEYVY